MVARLSQNLGTGKGREPSLLSWRIPLRYTTWSYVRSVRITIRKIFVFLAKFGVEEAGIQ